MDDTIQILVFIVTIIVFIVSAIMQQKKKPNAPKSSNFENIVESILGFPQEEPKFQREMSQNNYFQTEYNPEDSSQNESFKVKKEKMVELVDNEGVKGIISPSSNASDDHQWDDEELINHFDARQAIIYSEIINRKYF